MVKHQIHMALHPSMSSSSLMTGQRTAIPLILTLHHVPSVNFHLLHTGYCFTTSIYCIQATASPRQWMKPRISKVLQGQETQNMESPNTSGSDYVSYNLDSGTLNAVANNQISCDIPVAIPLKGPRWLLDASSLVHQVPFAAPSRDVLASQ